MGQIIARVSRDDGNTDKDIDPDVLRAALDAPSFATQLERFEPLRNSPFRGELIAIASDPANASLDVSNRLIVGEIRGAGAQADVFEGRLIANEHDLSTLRRKLTKKKRLDKYLKKHPETFKKVAVKQVRFIRFLEDDDKGVKVCK